MGASYIKSTTPYQTFTNDPHKNEIGHEQIALDLYRFIIQETNLKLKEKPQIKVKTRNNWDISSHPKCLCANP